MERVFVKNYCPAHRTMKALAFILLSGLMAGSGFGQGTFQNLNFESAVLVPISGNPTTVQFGPAFPGWTGYFGLGVLSPTFPANYNNINVGSIGLGLLDQNSPFGGSISNLTAVLQSSTLNGSPDLALAQTGMVPGGTLSLRFDATTFNPNFVVSLNGQPLSLSVLQDFGTYKEYGANIASFGGQTAELRFTKLRASGDLYFDNVSFSPIAVPEPRSWALLGLGSVLFCCAARRRRN